VIDLAGIALAGGMFIVPLYAILQTQSPPMERSRTIAANNIVNAAIVVLTTVVITVMLALGSSVAGVIGALGFATLCVAGLFFWFLYGGRYRMTKRASPDTNPASDR
jgi:acyl-[acyl-carrier-protein]-phospholipid O-acyltransferase/long-chain-fatty-acid--[acyl-carrier-protein] ligase